MLKREFCRILFTVLFVCGLSFLMAQNPGFAQMSEMQNPRYDEHARRAHGIEAPGVVVELKTTPE